MKEESKTAAPETAKKKPYHAPRLREHGSLRKLTMQKPSIGADLSGRHL